ncbi:TPA: hypothetical protein ACKRFR_003615 [Proteus mirabilis]|uniref:hypothetical protein n=1 Tax=Proteus terrae TaxID=1574161 RepID=UPI00301D09CB
MKKKKGKKGRKIFGKEMLMKINESKLIAKEQLANMHYNSKPLDITCSTPSSNIRWATKR